MRRPRRTNACGAINAVCVTVVLWWSFLVLPTACFAQPVMYASGSGGASPLPGPGTGRGQSHGWVAVPSMTGTALVHVPPRTPGLNKAAADGTMRQARELKVAPVALAGVGGQVFIISDAPGGPGLPARRSVESLRALPSAVGDHWFFEPEGHAREHPDLPARGPVEGFVGTTSGPVALADGQLWLLDDRGWNEIEPPSPLLGRGWNGTVRLLSMNGRAAILAPGPRGEVEVWTGEITAPRGERPAARSKRHPRPARDQGDVPSKGPRPQETDTAIAPVEYSVLWSMETYAADGSLIRAGLVAPWIGDVAGVLTYVGARDDGSVAVGTITRQSSYELATIRGVGSIFGVVPIEDAARVAVVWLEKEREGAEPELRVQRRSFPTPSGAPPTAPPGSPTGDQRETPGGIREIIPVEPESREPTAAAKSGAARVRGHLEIREISVFTGATVYAGPQRGDGPVSAFEVQLLAGVLVLVMIVVLILVLTREPDNGVFHLPRGTALAEPGRRAMAGVIDLAAAILIADKAWGVPTSDLLGPNRIFSGEALWVLGTAILIGLTLGTIGEWLTGRSFGKALMGCAVVDARDPGAEPGAPKFWQALVRNLVKWGAAPAAMLGLMESTGRHRGDALSRTLVCIGADDEHEESNDRNDPDRS